MENNQKLKSLLIQQKTVFTQLEEEVQKMENSDLAKENRKLKAELEKLGAEYEQARQKAGELSSQNAGLKNALHEQIYNEKLQLLRSSKERIDLYFKQAWEQEANRLTVLENGIRSRIDAMTASLDRNQISIKDELRQKLEELSAQLNEKITKARAELAQTGGAFSQQEREALQALKQEQITDEQILAVAKKNNVERFVGLNLLNAIGIFLIVVGVITAASYTYTQLSDVMKGIMMFVLGGGMLVAGELLNRKKPTIFSLGITAGGVSLLYVALATSYFGLEILSMYPALGLCVLITAAAFLLSTRYNSQVILAFALIGGYLPVFSVGSYEIVIYGAMVYFIVLNLLALLVSFDKKWTISSFLGLCLNIGGTVYICSRFGYESSPAGKLTAAFYALFAFLNYTLIPVVSTWKNRLQFRRHDVVLLGINTFFSSVILYLLFYAFGWRDFMGALAIGFAVVYLSLGCLIGRLFDGEETMQALFYLTGLAFTVLIVPFQFGRNWLTLGWLAEGVLLTVYGILKEQKTFRRSGLVIGALCLWSFLLFDLLWRMGGLFAWKYLAITAGSLLILGAYAYKNTLSNGFQQVYKCTTIVNLWFYSLYICVQINRTWGYAAAYDLAYLCRVLMVIFTFLLAYTAPRIRRLSDMPVKIISIILYSFGILWLFAVNSLPHPLAEQGNLSAAVLGTVILIGICLLSVLAVRDLVKLIVMERKMGVEWYPLIISSYFVIVLTQNLITQYSLSFASAWISIIYVLTALVWILFGFARRYSFIRKFGLGLAMLSVAKLFLIDLFTLTTGKRIVSYFALGITLVAISFVYQYFSKRLELKLEGEGEQNES